ncbi:AsnC family transcriptional regulator [Ruixingdingia sedimenti]|uniref:siroheme decarboxylase n=1 Tax=Ruixingdingia sedimenti TaxID=3073604 RepID=A0ABU1F9H0_9RHOB|nr:AsnC family transcriptional regulator [Xinfangfangia sp. LG-4]MDR5653521.1 AsnC family transcriptional regulator [Xinfangfangia sp. LG-4]
METLDPIDLRLLDDFQRDFPLVERPFAVLGAALGLAEGAVIDRLARLHAAGKVARVGATVQPNTAGASTLAAMAVPEARVAEVAAIVGAEPGVNHSYLRETDWNLWFVATAADTAELAAALDRIRTASGLTVLDLWLVRAFNIDLGFRLTGGAQAMPAPRAPVAVTPDPGDRALLHALSQGLDLTPAPFAALAARLGREEPALRDRIGALAAAGVITRLGVIVRHRALGFTANAMVVWDPPADRIEPAGRALAALPGVTLAYERRPVPGVWPWRLYSMIHARDRDAALAVLAGATRLPVLRGVPHRVLFSTRCFKQSGAQIERAA